MKCPFFTDGKLWHVKDKQLARGCNKTSVAELYPSPDFPNSTPIPSKCSSRFSFKSTLTALPLNPTFNLTREIRNGYMFLFFLDYV